ncbi:hypothetical protein INT47_009855 [Mucor saturninus]|uniref:NADH:flavin oxidoreductase/NADH oxidase N-terminal domain-containing protein n=1 Tax=Mucor saturninus TaxID=64648 RepID=A0A8H7QXL1_9FUNG|nr:hypothetical protein INT47_009855 [Mucor saturninus]
MTVSHISQAVQPQGTNPSPETVSNESTPKLFTPITCKSVTLHNRIVVPPMCMYSCTDGFFNDFHVAHYGSFALKRPGMIIIEATGVEARGRISPHDAGLWSDDHIAPLKRVVDFIKSQGSVPSIQIAHAGRKANMGSSWTTGYINVPETDGGWPNNVIGPSEARFDDQHADVQVLTVPQLKEVAQKWADAAVRAHQAGIEVLEIHSAHGYLLHNFLSAHSNHRTDQYGGSLQNRLRFPLEVVQAVRDVWPQEKPLWVRFSASDCKSPDPQSHDEEGWDVYQAIEYAKALKAIGVDVIDVSSGGNRSDVNYVVGKLYQVPFSKAVKHEAGIPTGAVGLIIEPKDAEEILQKDEADYILVGREHLRDPAWTNRAAAELGIRIEWVNQYQRANTRIRK